MPPLGCWRAGTGRSVTRLPPLAFLRQHRRLGTVLLCCRRCHDNLPLMAGKGGIGATSGIAAA